MIWPGQLELVMFFEWWSVIKRYHLMNRNWEELDLSGTGNNLLCHPSKSICIPDKLEFSLNAIVKSPFLTNDAICFPELVTIEAHGLELRAEELLLLSKTSSLSEMALWTSRTPLEHELFQEELFF